MHKKDYWNNHNQPTSISKNSKQTKDKQKTSSKQQILNPSTQNTSKIDKFLYFEL